MSEACSHDCGSCSSDCSSREQKSLKVAPGEGTSIKHVIGVVSGKGGVGKSLVTSLLASAMSKQGYKVGILDADITGPSIPKMFGTAVKAGATQNGIVPGESHGGIKFMSINAILQSETEPVIWRGPVIAGVVTQFWKDVVWGDLDYLFVDMPPGTGDVPLTVFQSLPVDGVVVVASPQDLVEMIVGKAVKMAEMMKIPVLGLVMNMAYFVCPNCKEKHYIFGEKKAEDLAKTYGIAVSAEIPMNPKVATLCDQSKIELADTSCLDSIADAVMALEK